jgi:hypothetical protein
MFNSRLTLQGDDFSSVTANDLPQKGREGHKKLASRFRAGAEAAIAKKEAPARECWRWPG